MTTNLTFTRERSKVMDVTVTDNDGNAFDLTNYVMYFIAKTSYDVADGSATITKQAVISTPASGVGTLTFTVSDLSIDAGSYIYEVYVYNSGTGVAYQVESGTLYIERNVRETL